MSCNRNLSLAPYQGKGLQGHVIPRWKGFRIHASGRFSSCLLPVTRNLSSTCPCTTAINARHPNGSVKLEACKSCKHHTYCRPLLACKLDSPKSVMTQLKCSSTSTLPGFRSPCTTCKQQQQQWVPAAGLGSRHAALQGHTRHSSAFPWEPSCSTEHVVALVPELVSCLKQRHNCNTIAAQPAAQHPGLWYRYS